MIIGGSRLRLKAATAATTVLTYCGRLEDVSLAVRPLLARDVEAAKLRAVSDAGGIPIGRKLPTQLPDAADTTSAVGRAFASLRAQVPDWLKTVTDPKKFDPRVLEGRSFDEIVQGMPKWWEVRPATKGDGLVFSDPAHRGRYVRVMRAYPSGSRPDPLTWGPYVAVRQNGDKFKFALKGNPTLR